MFEVMFEVLADAGIKFQTPKHKKFYFSLVAQCAYINKRIKGATVRVVGKKLTSALED